MSHAAQQTAVTNDPYLTFQWHLINYGQLVGGLDASFLRGVPGEDINIEGAWDLATGRGVQIGIVDTGVQLNHPDLVDNIRTDLAINLGGGGDAYQRPRHGGRGAGGRRGQQRPGHDRRRLRGRHRTDSPVLGRSAQSDWKFVTDAIVAQALIYQFQQDRRLQPQLGPVAGNPRQMIDLGPLSLTALAQFGLLRSRAAWAAFTSLLRETTARKPARSTTGLQTAVTRSP